MFNSHLLPNILRIIQIAIYEWILDSSLGTARRHDKMQTHSSVWGNSANRTLNIKYSFAGTWGQGSDHVPINTGSHLQFGSSRKSSWQQSFNFDLIVHNTSTSTALKHLTLPVTCQEEDQEDGFYGFSCFTREWDGKEEEAHLGEGSSQSCERTINYIWYTDI